MINKKDLRFMIRLAKVITVVYVLGLVIYALITPPYPYMTFNPLGL